MSLPPGSGREHEPNVRESDVTLMPTQTHRDLSRGARLSCHSQARGWSRLRVDASAGAATLVLGGLALIMAGRDALSPTGLLTWAVVLSVGLRASQGLLDPWRPG